MQEAISGPKPLTAFHLKLIALTTMVIDHIVAVFPFPALANSLMRGIGRMAFPISGRGGLPVHEEPGEIPAAAAAEDPPGPRLFGLRFAGVPDAGEAYR